MTPKTWLRVLALMLGATVAAGLWAAPADGLSGHWQPDNDSDVIVTISRNTDGLQGYVTDHRVRPDKAKGVHVLRDFDFDAGENLWRGQVYSARRDRLFSGSIRVLGPDEFELEAGWGFIRRTVVWHRTPAARLADAGAFPGDPQEGQDRHE